MCDYGKGRVEQIKAAIAAFELAKPKLEGETNIEHIRRTWKHAETTEGRIVRDLPPWRDMTGATLTTEDLNELPDIVFQELSTREEREKMAEDEHNSLKLIISSESSAPETTEP